MTVSYRMAVRWIAENDAPGDIDGLEILKGYISVVLVADLWRKEPGVVAADVLAVRDAVAKAEGR